MLVWLKKDNMLSSINGRQKARSQRVDEINREINGLTSDLLDGGARRQFLDTWNTLND
jgi:hypothetical protein